ncbi:hypothetical protein GL093_03555 [Salmonella enterica]|nr:hypothetical protein [Salmonella enterica]
MAKAPKAAQMYVVIKRVGTVIHYQHVADENALPKTLDLKGYTYKSLRKGINFQFEGDVAAPENVRYYAYRGTSERLPLAKTTVGDGKTAANKTTVSRGKTRGATCNESIFRKHF